MLPGRRILLAGTGPLLPALASQIAKAGGKTAAVLEAGRPLPLAKMLRGAWGHWGLIKDAAHYFWDITKARIPLLPGHILVEARGDGRVEEAVAAPVDKNWRPMSTGRITFSVDTVCVGYGFISSTELTRLAGCRHDYSRLMGGWVVARNHDMETSVSGLFAAGDCAGVAGSLVAEAEGHIAGLAAARDLGRISPDRARQKARPVRRRLAHLQRLRRLLDLISMPRPGLYQLAKPDTLVCRCEEITLAEILAAAANGGAAMKEIKRMTRSGMGRCQGRMCGPAVMEIAARARNTSPESLGHFNVRPPVKPIFLSAGVDPMDNGGPGQG